MLMLLDSTPPEAHIKLATKLTITVVVEREGGGYEVVAEGGHAALPARFTA